MRHFSAKQARATEFVVTLLIFLFGLFGALSWMSASFDGNQFHFLGGDSFYHATRIIATAIDVEAFYQFDPRSYAPEGAYSTWPWAYDFLMALALKGWLFLHPSADPVLFLCYVPVLWILFNGVLLARVAIELGMGPLARISTLALFMMLPITHYLHAFGRIDHHYIELTFILAALLTGLRWMEVPESIGRAAMAGFVLGLAPAFHTGLFILQLPVLANMFFIWRGQHDLPGSGGSKAFVLSLILTTGAVLMPAETAHQAFFSTHYLSWFHFYVACGTSLAICYLRTFAYSPKFLVIGFSLAAVICAPLLSEYRSLLSFAQGNIQYHWSLAEIQSLFDFARRQGVGELIARYSIVVMIAPIIFMVSLVRMIFPQDQKLGFSAGFICLGLALMMSQFRFNYFGGYALAIGLGLTVNRILSLSVGNEYTRILAAVLVAISVLAPLGVLKRVEVPLANSFNYMVTKDLYAVMKPLCDESPGVILANWDDGHYVTFHTGCSVIATTMLITQEHVEKVAQLDQFMRMRPEVIVKEFPWIKHFFVHDTRRFTISAERLAETGTVPVLVSELLTSRNHEGLELVDELVVRLTDGQEQPYARVFTRTGQMAN